jgi:endoglucanase
MAPMLTNSRRGPAALLLATALVMALPAATSAQPLPPDARFYVPSPPQGANAQIAQLKAAGRNGAARKLRAMVRTPHVVWLVGGTPAEVREYVEETMAAAQAAGTVPAFAAYNVPGRDCSHYSAGGAANGVAYRAWIDAAAAGIGNARALVVVEPDGLPLLPADCGQPDPYDRVALIRYAALAFSENPNAAIYIDAGHSAWHSVGTIAARLVDAGVADVDGLALNTSNFQFSPNLTHYGTWVSKCIAYATHVSEGQYDDCPDQYGSWGGVGLSPYGTWRNDASRADLNTSAENARYAQLLGGTQPSTHFVLDTSRNGRGPWAGTGAHPASESDTEAWCNPPGRGAGKRPTANTGVALVDAYLWIKVPGESDGRCFRWTDGPDDPARGMPDPSAGAWFPQMALELAKNAKPAFR